MRLKTKKISFIFIGIVLALFFNGCGCEIEHNGVKYSTVTSPYTGKVWLDRNLGSKNVCASYDDSSCYGDLYQWGRNTDGHEKRTSSTTTTVATTTTPGHGELIILNDTDPWDWTSADASGTQRKALWSKTDGTSVCPRGFRVPTQAEIKAETLDIATPITKVSDFTNHFLKLPADGWRYGDTTGSFWGEGESGDIWTVDIFSTNSRNSMFLSTSVSSSSMKDMVHSRALGIRCIKDIANVP